MMETSLPPAACPFSPGAAQKFKKPFMVEQFLPIHTAPHTKLWSPRQGWLPFSFLCSSKSQESCNQESKTENYYREDRKGFQGAAAAQSIFQMETIITAQAWGAALEPWMPSGMASSFHPWKLDASLWWVESGPHVGAGQAGGHGQSVQATPGGETPTIFWF